MAQTSPEPIGLEIVRARGIYLEDAKGDKYVDLISGIGVSSLGHGNPRIRKAVNEQMLKYAHLMVYGEYIQSPQVKLAQTLCNELPDYLDNVYYTSSGSEAMEGALKLAKRFTSRSKIISFKDSYHGSTHGALSIMGNEEFKNSFRPLVPGVVIAEYDSSVLVQIDSKTAAVVVEIVRGEGGYYEVDYKLLTAIDDRCKAEGVLLIVDEIQSGMGRTGELFAFQHTDIRPDILTTAKAFGAGLPLAAFISSKEIMSCLTNDPVLGHITTFGGNPVCCAAGLEGLNILLEGDLIREVERKSDLFKENLHNPLIKEVRGKGLMLAVELIDTEQNMAVISALLKKKIITDWFLFCHNSFRIAPPLIISDEEVIEICKIISSTLDQFI